MRLTRLKKLNGEKLTNNELNRLGEFVINLMNAYGFIVEYEILSSSSLKIGLRGRSFKINTEILGYNTDMSYGQRRRTNVPSWEQHVVFNTLLNKVLDKADISAKVYNSIYIIRDGLKSFSEIDWENQTPEWIIHNEIRNFKKITGDYKQNFKNSVLTQKMYDNIDNLEIKSSYSLILGAS